MLKTCRRSLHLNLLRIPLWFVFAHPLDHPTGVPLFRFGASAKSQDCCTLPRKPLVLILGRLLWHDIACSEGGHVILCESIGKII